MLPSVFQAFVERSPIGVMAQAVVVNLFQPDRLDEWFERTAQRQYQRTLLFSAVVEWMHSVVLGVGRGGERREPGGGRLGEVREQDGEQRLGFDREEHSGRPRVTDQSAMLPRLPPENRTSRAKLCRNSERGNC